MQRNQRLSQQHGRGRRGRSGTSGQREHPEAVTPLTAGRAPPIPAPPGREGLWPGLAGVLPGPPGSVAL